MDSRWRPIEMRNGGTSSTKLKNRKIPKFGGIGHFSLLGHFWSKTTVCNGIDVITLSASEFDVIASDKCG